ncbi:MAG: T9SS type A sorting domain-containing protein [Chitinophagales bacterium]
MDTMIKGIKSILILTAAIIFFPAKAATVSNPSITGITATVDSNNTLLLAEISAECDTTWLNTYKFCTNISINEYYSDSLGTFYQIIQMIGSNGLDAQLITYKDCSGQHIGGCGDGGSVQLCNITQDSAVHFVRQIWDCYPCNNLTWLQDYFFYKDTIHDLRIHNGNITDQDIYSFYDGELLSRNAWARRGFILFVYDSNSGEYWQSYQIGNSCRGPFNDITCYRFPVNVFEFVTRDATDTYSAKEERQFLINFLDSIPCNAYVAGYSFYNAGYSQWASDSVLSEDVNLFKEFEDIGVSTIRQQEDNKPFVFLVRKCDPSFPSAQIKAETNGIIDTILHFTDTISTTVACKNQSVNEYLYYGKKTFFEIVPLDTTEPKTYYRCDGTKVTYCGYPEFDSLCNEFTSHLEFVRNVWSCDSSAVCDSSACVLPGDADHDLTVNNIDVLAIGLSYGHAGHERQNASIGYVLQPSADWQTQHYFGFNDKFSDCNGDGFINDADVFVVDTNYIAKEENIFNHRIGISDSLPAVTLRFDTIPVMVVNGLCLGAELVSDINVGSSTQTATDVYGMAFSVHYPFDNDSCFLIQVELDSASWFQTGNPVLLFYKNIPEFKRIDIAISRTDGVVRSGHGRVGKIKLITEGDIFGITRRMSGNVSLEFSVSDVLAVDNTGMLKDMTGSTVTESFLLLRNTESQMEGLEFYPNPVNGLLYIKAGENIESIEIMDVQGRMMHEFIINRNDVQLNLSGLKDGMYIAIIKGKNSRRYEKIIKQ